MKKLQMTLLILCGMAFAALPLVADTEKVGDYTWTYRINGDTAEIYGSEQCNNAIYTYIPAISPSPTGHVIIPSMLGGKPVTSIGIYAFRDCSGLTGVTIPSSVTSIGIYAFRDCSGLMNMTIPNSVTNIGASAFGGCSGLTSVTIPDGVTSIGGVFDGCSGLTSVTIPDSVTSIGGYAFYGCSSLTSVTIPDSVTSIGVYAFYGCRSLMNMTIPNGVTSIGYGAFYGCSGLTSVKIPDAVTSIGNIAFYYCSWLTNITVGDGVKSIGDSAFYGCGELISVIIPDSVTSIGQEAFSGCSRLTSMTIGDGVTSIGNSAFYNCGELISFTVSEYNRNYCSVNGLLLTKDGKTLVRGVNGDVVIPDGVTSIGAEAFSGCSSLTSVTIPNSVTNIGSSAFSGCSGLTSVTIPASVTSIGSFAFSECSGLTCVTIPASVTSLGASIFSGCSNLYRLDIPYSLLGWYGYEGAILGCPSGMEIHQYDNNGEITNTWSSITVNNIVYRYDSPIRDSWGNLISFQSHWCDWGWGIPYFTLSTADQIYSHAFCYNDRDLLAKCFSLYSESGEALEFGTDWILLPLDEAWRNYNPSMGVPAGVYRFLIIGIGAYAGTYYFDIQINKAEYDAGPWQIRMSFNDYDMYYYYGYYGSDLVYYGNYGANDAFVASSYMYYSAPQLEMNVNSNQGDSYNISYGTASDGGSSDDNMYTATVTFLNAGRYEVSASVSGFLYEDEYSRSWFSSGNESCTIVIRPRPIEELNVSLSEASRTVVYTGEEIWPSLEWVVDDRTSFNYEYFTVTNAGTYQIAVGTEMNDDGYFYGPDCMSGKWIQWYSTYDELYGNCYAANYTGVTYVAYTVLPRPVAKNQAQMDLRERHCDGTPQTCSLVITNDYTGVVLVEGTDYDVAYSNNILAGTATATVTCKGNYTGTFSLDFEILPSANIMDVLGLDKVWNTGGNAEWFAEWFDNAHDGMSCMRSGTIGDKQESWIETVVTNTGIVSFWWKVSSEAYRDIAYDKLVFMVDGVIPEAVPPIGGEVDWTNVTYAVEGDGPHVLRWTYCKDESTSDGEDCAWLDDVHYLREVHVTFADGGATGGNAPDALVVGEGAEITIPNQASLVWPKHRFAGWRIYDETLAPGTVYRLGYDDVTFTAAWEEKRVSVPSIEVAAWYDTERTSVRMSCDTVGAAIHYTLDGSTPTTESPIYSGTFNIAGTATIRAVAVLDDWFDSDVVSAESVRAPWTPDECLNATGMVFQMGGTAEWKRDRTVTHDCDTAMRSGEIGDGQTSWIETTVVGAGTLTFWWKASSEAYKGTIYDCARFTVDGIAVIPDIGGEIDWRYETVTITGGGTHAIRWAYIKDAQDSKGSDCAWLDSVAWVADDPLPTLDAQATDGDVAAVVTGLSDARMSEKVIGTAAYAAFRTWVDGNGLSHTAVRDAPNAWLSYALDAPGLMAKAIPLAGEDIMIEALESSSGSGGTFDLVVGIDGVEIGTGARLAEALGIVGTAALDGSPFTSDGLTVSLERTADGKAKATVTPDGMPSSFFLRVKVK